MWRALEEALDLSWDRLLNEFMNDVCVCVERERERGGMSESRAEIKQFQTFVYTVRDNSRCGSYWWCFTCRLQLPYSLIIFSFKCVYLWSSLCRLWLLRIAASIKCASWIVLSGTGYIRVVAVCGWSYLTRTVVHVCNTALVISVMVHIYYYY
jgi:hypothetical protein